MYTPEETKFLLANHNECTFSSNELYASALKYIQQLEDGVDRVYKLAKDIKVPTDQPKWISTKDRLPRHGGSFLIATKNGAVCTAHYYPKTYSFDGHFAGIAAKHITHWMPLPEAPKEG